MTDLNYIKEVYIVKCNLVKKQVCIHLEKENKDVKIWNYYLVFENEEILPIELKQYSTKSTDKKDVEKIAKLNSTNYAKFSVLADSLKDVNSK